MMLNPKTKCQKLYKHKKTSVIHGGAIPTFLSQLFQPQNDHQWQYRNPIYHFLNPNHWVYNLKLSFLFFFMLQKIHFHEFFLIILVKKKKMLCYFWRKNGQLKHVRDPKPGKQVVMGRKLFHLPLSKYKY